MKCMLIKQRLSEQAYHILLEMITNSRFQSGTRLNIERLSREMEVSRTPLWEAVHRLIQEGLLISIPNRGVFIVDITPEKALEIYTVREVLEGLAARLACQNVDNQAIETMEKCLVAQHEMVINEDLVGYSKHDFEFHAAIHQLSGNKFLQEMLNAIRSKTRPASMNFIPLLRYSFNDHLTILKSLKSRDVTTTERVMKSHIRRLIRVLKKQMSLDSTDKKGSLEESLSESDYQHLSIVSTVSSAHSSKRSRKR